MKECGKRVSWTRKGATLPSPVGENRIRAGVRERVARSPVNPLVYHPSRDLPGPELVERLWNFAAENRMHRVRLPIFLLDAMLNFSHPFRPYPPRFAIFRWPVCTTLLQPTESYTLLRKSWNILSLLNKPESHLFATHRISDNFLSRRNPDRICKIDSVCFAKSIDSFDTFCRKFIREICRTLNRPGTRLELEVFETGEKFPKCSNIIDFFSPSCKFFSSSIIAKFRTTGDICSKSKIVESLGNFKKVSSLLEICITKDTWNTFYTSS